MNKTLRFAKDLVPLVLFGEKISTWRLWDDKNLSANDIADFVENDTGKIFAASNLVRVIDKPMGKLTQKDKIGHEKFYNDEEMYKTYTKYYGRKVDKDTIVKLIWFELIK